MENYARADLKVVDLKSEALMQQQQQQIADSNEPQQPEPEQQE